MNKLPIVSFTGLSTDFLGGTLAEGLRGKMEDPT